ncbi:MAG TPA: hypothetical protein PLP08_18045 [Plasticicumulans sp.]|uniref:hypothetical protein n=1 Tax=Plasticicumulans sp. TaxID=2307179 RepID=UPI002C70360C|nr:hypothetical protein [Plasticicumulans sp.]HMW31443.1 hypothetical protein [Plasticicumulans sp.]HNG51497.1 hypothetical protein [Plasticicumulans sp.]
MSRAQDGIVAYLELLHAHRHLIAAAWANGGALSAGDDNRRAVTELQRRRTLIPYIDDEFRLNPSLGRHLDEVFDRARLYAVGADLGAAIERLVQLVDEYEKAADEGRAEDAERYGADFDYGVFELAESLRAELLRLRTLTDNRYADVRTLAEKQRQNAFWLRRIERIGSALAAIADNGLRARLEAHAGLAGLHTVFEHQIGQQLAGWRTQQLDISATLKAFLYRLREVAPQASRLRSFALHLRQHPDYRPPAPESLISPPDWLARHTGLKLKAAAQLDRPVIAEALAEVAARVPPAVVSRRRERARGRLLDRAPAAAIELAPSPAQQALQQCLAAALESPVPLSVLGWKRAQAEFRELPEELWLLCVLHAAGLGHAAGHAGFSRLNLRRIEAPAAARAGNVVIHDLELWKKA